MTLLFLLLLSPWLCWCSSCHYYWCWHDCRRYCYHLCGIAVIIGSFFCSFRYLLCVITCSVLSLLFLHYCHFFYFVVAVFFVALAGTVVVAYCFMLLPLLLDGCCCDDYCGSQIGCCCCCCYSYCTAVTDVALVHIYIYISIYIDTHRGVIRLVKLQSSVYLKLFHGSFQGFLNCTNGTYSWAIFLRNEVNIMR